jgi:hypothetical protein
VVAPDRKIDLNFTGFCAVRFATSSGPLAQDGQRRSFRPRKLAMSQGAESNIYLVDVETFNALRRVVRRLSADDPLVDEDRRTLAVRMNSLLQRAQPANLGSGRPKANSEYGAPSSVLKESFWKLRAQA